MWKPRTPGTLWALLEQLVVRVRDNHCRKEDLAGCLLWPRATDIAPQSNVRFRKYSVSRRRPVYSSNTRRVFRSAFRPQSRDRNRTRHDRECQGIIAAVMGCNAGLQRCVERRDKIAELILLTTSD